MQPELYRTIRKGWPALLAALLFVVSAGAQSHPSCGTDAYHAQQLRTDPDYGRAIQQQKDAWLKHNTGTANKQPVGGPVTLPQGLVVNTASGPVQQIPVVFHIIHTGQAVGTAQNPSDATITALVNMLNAKYSATFSGNPGPGAGGVAVPIQFVLAKRTSACAATTGIVRVNGSSLSGYSTYGIAMTGAANGAPEASVKALSVWPTYYMNIWIVTGIQGAAANGGAVAGYATFPGTSPTRDGIVLRYDQTDWAITHEVGHFLGLYHTFQGSSGPGECPDNADCLSDGDEVCDTDPHPLDDGCPTGTNSCTGASYLPVVYNIMNYSSCPDRFTANQSSRMVYKLENERGALAASLGGLVPGTYPTSNAAPVTACVPASIGNANNNYEMGLRGVSLANLSYANSGYTGDGYQFYIDHTVNTCTAGQLTANLTAGQTYAITVPLGPYNSENCRAWIDWNNNGSFASTEQVLSFNGSGSGGEVATATFTVPAAAVGCTPLRMRISSDFYGSATPTACSNPEYGQTEDFTVIVGSTVSPAVTIAASQNPACAGASVTFTATATGVTGITPTYQWKKNGAVIAGATSATYATTALTNGNVITCVVSATACATTTSATSNAITMTVNANATPTSAITVSPSANICTGASVTFTSTTNVTGATRQWRKNGVNISGATGATYTVSTLINNDAITCVITKPAAACFSASTATSNTITMAVTPATTTTSAISVSPNDTVCAGTVVTFTSTTNATGTVTRQWYKNNVAIPGATAATYSYTPANNDQIKCSVAAAAGQCYTTTAVASAVIAMRVNPVVVPVATISVSDSTVCTNTSVVFTAVVTNGGATPIYQWRKNGVVVGSNSPTYSVIPTDGNTIYCIVTSAATCAAPMKDTSNVIGIHVSAPTTTTSVITVSPNDTVCAGTAVTFTNTTNVVGAVTRQWYKNNVAIPGATGATYSYTPANYDQIKCNVTAAAGQCYTTTVVASAVIKMYVNPMVVPVVTISVSDSTVCTNTSVAFTAAATNGGATPIYQWRKNGAVVGSNSPTYSVIPTDGNTVYCILTSTAACIAPLKDTSNVIGIHVSAPTTTTSVIAVSPNDTVCAGTAVTFTNTTNVVGAVTRQWYKNNVAIPGATGATYSYTPANYDQIKCNVTTAAGQCYTTTVVSSAVIKMYVNPVLVPVATVSVTDSDVCAGTSVTFTAAVVNGGSAPVYQWRKNGVVVGANAATYAVAPTNGNTVYCIVTSNATCAAPLKDTSNAISMDVLPVAPVSCAISVSPNDTVTPGTTVTFSSTSNATTATRQWTKNNVDIPGATGVTYSYVPASGDVIRCRVTATGSTECFTTLVATSAGITMRVLSTMIAPDYGNDDHTDPLMSGAAGQVHAYPNPTDDALQVAGMRPGDLLVLTDGAGRVLLRQTANSDGPQQMSLKALLPGMYYLHAGGQVLKIVKQ